jgi:multidrug efflux system outer membrane protein
MQSRLGRLIRCSTTTITVVDGICKFIGKNPPVCVQYLLALLQQSRFFLRCHAQIPARMRGVAITPVIFSFLLAGCAIKRDHYDVPVAPLPSQFQKSVLFPKAKQAPEAKESTVSANPVSEADLDEWWRSLGSAELNALVDQALANNMDLRIAMLRLAQSQARAKQAEADQYPVLTAPLEARHDSPPNGVNSATISSPSKIDHREYYQASLRGDWRVDLWGELSSLAESAEMRLWQATFQSDDTRRTLIASVVSKYIEYLSFNDRIRIAHQTEAELSSLLKAVSDRVEVGDATVIDLEQQRSADYAVQATIPALELQREQAAHALAQLVGVTPSALTLSNKGMDSLTFPGALTSVPSSLLVRRPDIRAVEARLLAADADIDVARARLFPPLNISSQGSIGMVAFAQFFTPYGVIYNALGNLTTTIFDHGKRSQDVSFARSMHEELVETYLHIVYGAVRETEDALTNTYMNGRRLEAQKVAVEASLRAWTASLESYEVGGIDFLTLIDTERTYYRTLDECHRIRQEHFQGLVSLYSALGGGVPQGGELPGDGVRPQAKIAKLSAPEAVAVPGIDWTGRHTDTDGEFWLVELAGLQDRSGVIHAWRDLNQRFPKFMAGHVALPRLQGKLANEQRERATWYRVFIGRFPSHDKAGDFCGQLGTKQLRCNVVSSDAEEFRDFMEDDTADNAPLAANDSAAKLAPASSDSANGQAKTDVLARPAQTEKQGNAGPAPVKHNAANTVVWTGLATPNPVQNRPD